MHLCQMCGNELERGVQVCPFCGSSQELTDSTQPKGKFHKTVNLKVGMPFVEEAIKRLQREIAEAKQQHISSITVIHGYGSTGAGGAIRVECRKMLDYFVSIRAINTYLPGETFNHREKSVKNILQRYPALANNKNYNRNNPGITLVIL